MAGGCVEVRFAGERGIEMRNLTLGGIQKSMHELSIFKCDDAQTKLEALRIAHSTRRWELVIRALVALALVGASFAALPEVRGFALRFLGL